MSLAVILGCWRSFEESDVLSVSPPLYAWRLGVQTVAGTASRGHGVFREREGLSAGALAVFSWRVVVGYQDGGAKDAQVLVG